MLLHSLMCLSVWCVAIHEMPALIEITAKIDHVLFSCNYFFRLRKRAHMCMLLQKSYFENFSKFQQLQWSLFFFHKRFISTTGECDLKKNSSIFVFLYCDINQFNQSMEIPFFFYLGFLSQLFTNRRTVGEGGGHSFNSSLPLPLAWQTLRH